MATRVTGILRESSRYGTGPMPCSGGASPSWLSSSGSASASAEPCPHERVGARDAEAQSAHALLAGRSVPAAAGGGILDVLRLRMASCRPGQPRPAHLATTAPAGPHSPDDRPRTRTTPASAEG